MYIILTSSGGSIGRTDQKEGMSSPAASGPMRQQDIDVLRERAVIQGNGRKPGDQALTKPFDIGFRHDITPSPSFARACRKNEARG
jgi:hypothetical protein